MSDVLLCTPGLAAVVRGERAALVLGEGDTRCMPCVVSWVGLLPADIRMTDRTPLSVRFADALDANALRLELEPRALLLEAEPAAATDARPEMSIDLELPPVLRAAGDALEVAAAPEGARFAWAASGVSGRIETASPVRPAAQPAHTATAGGGRRVSIALAGPCALRVVFDAL